MSAYAVAMRLDRSTISVRPGGTAGVLPAGPHQAAVPEAGPFEELHAFGTIASGEVRDRWEAIRECWTQTTFYLFDPDSWR